MSKTFTTICPHCKETINIPYSQITKDLGSRSAAKLRNNPGFMQDFVQKGVATRWGHNHLHTKEQAILDLANSEDINTLTYREIADKVGITGKWRVNAAWYFTKRLVEKGLISMKSRYAPQDSTVVEESLHPKQRAILSIARSEDMKKLTYAEIADRIGLTGKSRRNDVFYHISYLRKRGLLPASENRR